jgi:predicted Ser/Thr protein kinase
MAGTLTKAGRYEVVRELGRGSMGVVYQGRDPVIGRTVAIKTMRTEGLTPDEFREFRARFQREAQAAGVLSHPNIVSVFDYGEDSGVLYLIMEFLEGKSLEKLVEGQHILPIETIIPMCEQVCGALDHAHQHGIVHRDIKPANIMILNNGLVKVTDFGIAKMMSMGMTQTGQVLGTPNYMSPEQVKGRQIDGRSDIFSLGIILYDLVTGEMPFAGQNITTVIYKIINENPIPPRELDATIHPGLSYVICKALAKSPEERYQTCRELAYDMKNFKLLGGPAAASTTAILKSPPLASADMEGAAAPPVKRPTPPIAPPEAARMAPAQQASPGQAPVQVIAPAPAPRKPHAGPMVWILMALLGVAILGILGGGYLYLSKGKRQAANPQSQTANLQSQLPSPQPQAGIPPPQTPGPEFGQSPAGVNSASAGLPARAPQSPSKAQAEKPAADRGKPSSKPSEAPAAIPPPSPASGGHSASSLPAAGGGGAGAAPKTGQLLVTANVPGAKISVDGSSDPNWVTPYSSAIERSAGTHQVVISKEGYDDYSQFVSLEGGKTITVNAQLVEAKGDVVIMTTPPGLEVSIDGKVMGPSPVRVTLPVGNHKYTVKRAGWEPFEGSFAAKSGAVITVKVNMGG